MQTTSQWRTRARRSTSKVDRSRRIPLDAEGAMARGRWLGVLLLVIPIGCDASPDEGDGGAVEDAAVTMDGGEPTDAGTDPEAGTEPDGGGEPADGGPDLDAGCTSTVDSDGDGVSDCDDLCPGDPMKTEPGTCGCGTPDDDTDSDGTADCLDECPADPAKTAAGMCGCGTPDTDTDSDGTADCLDGCPSDPAKTAAGMCGCGTPDTDTDADGTADCLDGCPSDPAKTAAGMCGCGTPDTDGDSDGTADCLDGCPSDPAKIAPGVCGCGVSDADGDGDGVADCDDVCPADPTATTTPHSTPALLRGNYTTEAVPNTASWSLLSAQPYATLDNVTGNRVATNWLYARDFGFSIPSTAQILGITMSLERQVSSADGIPVRDLEIRLYRSPSIRSPADRAVTTSWPDTGYGPATYGGPTDTWGRSWTAAEVNGAGFGVGVRATMYSYPPPSVDLVSANPLVRNVTLTVTYCAM